jgi:Protein of unknown function (DUF3616)
MSDQSAGVFPTAHGRRAPAELPRSRRALGTRRFLLMAVATFILGAWPARSAEPPVLKPDSPPWSAGDGFDFANKRKKTRQSVSGIACPAGTTDSRVCLFAFDEGVEARFAALGGNALRPLPGGVALLVGGGELDAEGAALDGGFLYVTGSHSVKRGDCDANPNSRHVVRFRRDPQTGLARRAADGSLMDYADRSLWALMQTLPDLAPYVGRCLGTEPVEDRPARNGERGINIEGIAAGGGRLHFGFRGPVVDKRAPILAVDAAGLFEGGRLNPEVTWLELGGRRGIRDLQAVSDGILILAGPDDDKASEAVGWAIALWDGQADADGIGRPKLLGSFDLQGLVRDDCDKEIKPEALAVLEDSPSTYRVVVLSDGMCDGGPLPYRVRR